MIVRIKFLSDENNIKWSVNKAVLIFGITDRLLVKKLWRRGERHKI